MMLAPLLFTVSLEGLQPGPAALREPLPLVWYDHVREQRAVRHLMDLASRLTDHGFRCGARMAEFRIEADAPTTATAATPVAWASAVFSQSA
ncbi:MAG: hypothetical protein V3T28_11450 [Gemmatimonadales bacterium]